MRNFLIFGCTQMREGIMFSFAFLAAGITMGVLSHQIKSDIEKEIDKSTDLVTSHDGRFSAKTLPRRS